MTLSEMVTQLVGAVEGLVAIDVGTLEPGLLVLPHVTTVVAWATERLRTSVRAAVSFSGIWVVVSVGGSKLLDCSRR